MSAPDGSAAMAESRATDGHRRGWTLGRRVLNMALAETAGLAMAWLLTITRQWRAPPPTAALAAMGLGLGASVAVLGVCLVAVTALGARAKADRLRLLRARVTASTPAAGSVTPADHVAMFSASRLSRSRWWRRAACWACAAAGLIVLASLVRTPLAPMTVALLAVGGIVRTARFRVAVGPGGVRVTSGLGRTLFDVPLAAVRSARVVDLYLADYGGPILRRVSRRASGQPGCVPVFLRVLADGPALALDLCDGGLMVCSLSDAPGAAGVVAGLAGPRIGP